MKQLVVDRLPERGASVALREDQRHYLLRVRRLGHGDRLLCTDEQGRRGEVELAVAEGTLRLHLVRELDGPTDRRPTVLAAALLKGRRFETVLRQATELGVHRIVPVLAEHCVSRPDPGELRRKSARWEAIAREATQQSGRPGLPVITPPVRVAQLADEGPGLVLDESEGEPLHRAIERLETEPVLRFVIGPEGGLSDAERQQLHAAGWTSVHLPFPVLRAETAAVAATALVQLLASDYTAASTARRTSDG